jgi:hypothetical protein
MSTQPYLFGPVWIPIKDGNVSGMNIFLRHYTARQTRKVYQFIGPGDKEAYLTPDAKALFVWRKFISDAGEKGINCAVFRNEGSLAGKSSELIEAACWLAWDRWPGERLYTYIDPSKVKHKRDPGRCFRKAGFRYVYIKVGKQLHRKRTKSGKLIMERFAA